MIENESQSCIRSESSGTSKWVPPPIMVVWNYIKVCCLRQQFIGIGIEFDLVQQFDLVVKNKRFYQQWLYPNSKNFGHVSIWL
jgi:hypothetical protein